MNTTPPRSGRMVLLLIAGIPVTMILAATWLWFFVVRGDLDLVEALGTANHGSLVQPPRALGDAMLPDDAGVRHRQNPREPQWTLLVVGSAECAATCERTLYVTRQIHAASGRYMPRIRRVFVSETPAMEIELTAAALSDGRPLPGDFTAWLARDHLEVVVLQLESGVSEQLFPEWRADPATWYLVDPRGWIMMTYNDQTSYKGVIADLKFLLKNSGG